MVQPLKAGAHVEFPPMPATWTCALERLRQRQDDLTLQWNERKPYRWLVIENFLPEDLIDQLWTDYPEPDAETWTRRDSPHQFVKLTQNQGFDGVLKQAFDFMESAEFTQWLSDVTGVTELMSDPTYRVGGGLHQIGDGGFLDVHVDFNIHNKTKSHRRLNLLLYLNKDWEEQWGGKLSLWDLRDGKEDKLQEYAPFFNRAIVFETNEISYHGHPEPLELPDGHVRKSIALYYYTEERDDGVVASEHNTMYRALGAGGKLKAAKTALGVARERLEQDGLSPLAKTVARKLYEKVMKVPPKNG